MFNILNIDTVNKEMKVLQVGLLCTWEGNFTQLLKKKLKALHKDSHKDSGTVLILVNKLNYL